MAFKLDKKQKYLLACSYGPDSMALFSLLMSAHYNFEVAHVNYGLRKEAKKETENLVKYCEENNVKIHVLNVKKMDEKNNLEAECRKIRYEFFKKVMKKSDLKAVLVAHNEDDLIETYLMQKNRKNIVNYFGIAEKTEIFDIEVIRPLLMYTKASLQKYCDQNKVPYAIDLSNLTDEFERNKIRHNIVSKMDKEKRRNILGEIAQKNRDIANRDKYLNCIDLNDVKTLLSLNDEFLAVGLNIMVRRFDKNASISLPLSKEIRKILESSKPNVRLPLSNNMVFVKAYEECYFNGIGEHHYSYVMKRPQVLDTPFFYADFSSGAANRNVSINDYPITIRRANPNDIIQIKDYEVEARRLFIDWKMPTDLRNRWPVIVNREGKVIYIPHYQKDFDIVSNLNFYVKKSVLLSKKEK